MRKWMALAMVCAMQATVAWTIGIEDKGTYRTYNGENAPADITENVRIIPPPTGGNLVARIRTDKPRYHIGDRIKLTFGVNRDSYVFIFVTDAAGVSRQVLPNYHDQSNFLRAGRTYYIPDRGYDLEITAPVGNESVTIVAVSQNYPFLDQYHRYTRKDPYPASREGATALVRRIESFRTEPSALGMEPLRPAIRENLWATDSTTYRVMGTGTGESRDYKVARYGTLDIDTVPNNARIYIDGQYYGRTPQVVPRVAIGAHNVLLTKEGYVPYEVEVYVGGNETKQMDVFLKQTPIQPGYSKSGKWSNVKSGFGIGFFDPCE